MNNQENRTIREKNRNNTDISRQSLIYYQVHCSIPGMCCFQPVNISHQRSIATQNFSPTSNMQSELLIVAIFLHLSPHTCIKCTVITGLSLPECPFHMWLRPQIHIHADRMGRLGNRCLCLWWCNCNRPSDTTWKIPPADVGYPLRWDLLVPFRGVQYHLAEWGCASVW